MSATTRFRILTIGSITLALALSLPLAAAPGAGAPGATARGTGEDGCGVHPARLAATLARHQSHQRQLQRERLLMEPSGVVRQAPPDVSRNGQIAVIEDDGTIIAPPRPFDLSGRSIQFLRRPRGMSAVRSSVGYNDSIGAEPFPFLFGSTYVPFDNGLRFPFFDRVYEGVWVSEDGYLSFDEPDAFQPRQGTLDFLLGTPAIAPLFVDLDPEAADGTAGVYVKLMPRRARITWLRLPQAGTDRLVTAQVTLYDTGRILFAYGDDVEASYGIAGVFPGSEAQENAYHLDFDVELPQPPRRAALFEFFIDQEQVDEFALIEAFYEHFQDRYDQLIVWFDFPLATGDGGGAFQFTLKNDVRGIGVPSYDLTSLLGTSTRRLESYVQMGYLGQYPDDPDEVVADTDSTMGLLAHQVGHRWLGLVRHRSFDGGNQGGETLNLHSFPDLEHWSFYFDTDGSFLGGNDIEDNGDGTFTTVGATSRYCDLDLYLMGLIPASEVANFFYLNGLDFGSPSSSAVPQIGVTMTGRRVDVAMWQVTDAMGPRVPSSADAAKVFNMAFVLLARQGEPPSVESLEKLNHFRRYWHRIFKEATDFHGRVNTTLRNK